MFMFAQKTGLRASSNNANISVRCKHHSPDRLPSNYLKNARSQTDRIKVGKPGDRFERQADQVANAVLHHQKNDAVPHSSRTETIQSKQSLYDDESNELKVQAKSHNASQAPTSVTPRYLGGSGYGSPLSKNMRSRIEPVVKTNLAHVRVHNDAAAHEAAHELHAKAFTHKNHIYLGKNQDPEDLKLMAHEATHVLQQLPLNNDDERQPLFNTSEDMIQKDEQEGEDEGFDFNLIPPRLRYSLGDFSLLANTSRTQLNYDVGPGSVGLGYNYGNDIFARSDFGFLNAQLGYNPSANSVNGSIGGTYDDFRYGLSGNYGFGTGRGNLGMNFGYGAPLLPMPNVFSEQAMAAGSALPGLIGAIPGAFSDPMGAYDANGDRIDAVSTFGSTAAKLYKAQQAEDQQRFGLGLNFNTDFGSNWGLSIGARGRF